MMRLCPHQCTRKASTSLFGLKRTPMPHHRGGCIARNNPYRNFCSPKSIENGAANESRPRVRAAILKEIKESLKIAISVSDNDAVGIFNCACFVGRCNRERSWANGRLPARIQQTIHRSGATWHVCEHSN